MAKKPAKGNYLTLEDVRITYDKKTDSVHLTSKDKDLPEGGFHLTLNKGREAEQALRSLLIDAGMAQPKAEDTIPKKLEFNIAEQMPQVFLGKDSMGKAILTDPTASPLHIIGGVGRGKTEFAKSPAEDTVPKTLEFSIEEQTLGITLGKGPEGKSVRWVPSNYPHLFISGTVGRGKTHLLHNLIHAGVVQNALYRAGIINERWEFYMTRDIPETLRDNYYGRIPDTYIRIQGNSQEKGFLQGRVFPQSLEGIDALLEDCLAEIDSRYEERYERDFPQRMVMIDEASLLIQSQTDSESVAQSKKVIWRKLHQIARIGRSARVHLVIASQNPALLDSALGYGIKSLFGVISVGKQSKQSSIILTGGEAASLISDDIRGRCYTQGFGYTGEFQTFHYSKDSAGKLSDFLKSMSTLPPRNHTHKKEASHDEE